MSQFLFWGLLEKILSGEKKIESRWYSARFAPWDQISAGDTIYFEYAGMPMEAKAKVRKVSQFSDLTPRTVKALWQKYGKQIGVTSISPHIESTKRKKYCILIYLEQVQKIHPWFAINKTGFGNECAWLTVRNIDSITARTHLHKDSGYRYIFNCGFARTRMYSLTIDFGIWIGVYFAWHQF